MMMVLKVSHSWTPLSTNSSEEKKKKKKTLDGFKSKEIIPLQNGYINLVDTVLSHQ